MKRSHHTGCFLIVEGRDERLFFEQFVDRDACVVKVVDGKPNVVCVISILEADHFPGVVGVIDADFDHVEGTEWKSENLIVLETMDLEALLVRSPALGRVLVELGSDKKIARFGKDVRQALIEAAVPIGCLRLYPRRSNLNLKFDGMRYARCIDADSLVTDAHALIREVKNRSRRSELACGPAVQEIHAVERSVEDRWLVCCGTDMVAILGIGLRKTLGTNNARAVEPEVLRRYLRLAYDWTDLNDSRLAHDLRAWTENNQGYRVLKESNGHVNL